MSGQLDSAGHYKDLTETGNRARKSLAASVGNSENVCFCCIAGEKLGN